MFFDIFAGRYSSILIRQVRYDKCVTTSAVYSANAVHSANAVYSA